MPARLPCALRHVCCRPILQGIKVVELATVIAAPSCAAVLADFGADVTKIEAPSGDMWVDSSLFPHAVVPSASLVLKRHCLLSMIGGAPSGRTSATRTAGRRAW